MQVLHPIESLALKTEGGQINIGHLHFIFNYCFPGSGFTRPGLRIDNSVLTGETSRRPGSARHGIPVADPFQDRDLLQPQGV